MPQRRDWQGGDEAVSDFVGTLLLVAMVVVLGSVVAVMVTTSLSTPSIPQSSFSMAPAASGDASIGVIYRNGEGIPLSALAVTLVRDGVGPTVVPPANWTTPNPAELRAGDRLSVLLGAPLVDNETVRLRFFRTDLNVMLTEVATRTGGAATLLGVPTITVAATPPSLPADGATVTRLTVEVSHPAGGLAVARVEADLSNASQAAGGAAFMFALRDDGRVGDEVGGDGVWSGLYAFPTGTPEGAYVVAFRVVDASGRSTAAANLSLNATAVVLGGGPPVQNGTGEAGQTTYVGSNFPSPTSSNVTQLLMRNWTYDRLHPDRLDDDFAMVRVSGGGEAWTGRVKFEDVGGIAYAIEYRVWSQVAETVYTPTAFGSRLALDGMTLNLLDPTLGGAWARTSGDAHPLGLYPNAGVESSPRFIIPFLGQDKATSNAEASLDTGIISVDVVVT